MWIGAVRSSDVQPCFRVSLLWGAILYALEEACSGNAQRISLSTLRESGDVEPLVGHGNSVDRRCRPLAALALDGRAIDSAPSVALASRRRLAGRLHSPAHAVSYPSAARDSVFREPLTRLSCGHDPDLRSSCCSGNVAPILSPFVEKRGAFLSRNDSELGDVKRARVTRRGESDRAGRADTARTQGCDALVKPACPAPARRRASMEK